MKMVPIIPKKSTSAPISISNMNPNKICDWPNRDIWLNFPFIKARFISSYEKKAVTPIVIMYRNCKPLGKITDSYNRRTAAKRADMYEKYSRMII